MIARYRNQVAIITRPMSDSHPHHHGHDHATGHGHAHAPAPERRAARVDTLLASAGSRLAVVAVVCAALWAVLWTALRAG